VSQVLATGLSGLYSSLPARLQVYSEDWHCLDRGDWQQVITTLGMLAFQWNVHHCYLMGLFANFDKERQYKIHSGLSIAWIFTYLIQNC